MTGAAPLVTGLVWIPLGEPRGLPGMTQPAALTADHLVRLVRFLASETHECGPDILENSRSSRSAWRAVLILTVILSPGAGQEAEYAVGAGPYGRPAWGPVAGPAFLPGCSEGVIEVAVITRV
jgi:hypothetical protein